MWLIHFQKITILDGMFNGNPYEEGTYREFYASLDVNLRNIKTDKKFFDKALKILSFIKVPMPAFKLSQNKLTFYPLHYGQ